jgi:hypothetical protein
MLVALAEIKAAPGRERLVDQERRLDLAINGGAGIAAPAVIAEQHRDIARKKALSMPISPNSLTTTAVLAPARTGEGRGEAGSAAALKAPERHLTLRCLRRGPLSTLCGGEGSTRGSARARIIALHAISRAESRLEILGTTVGQALGSWV